MVSTATATAPLCAGPDPDTRKPKLKLPAGATDCHAHIFGPMARHPYSPDRIYTPPDASLADYERMLKVLGVERAVIVQPSVYGSDNTVTLEAVHAGGERFRAVVVVEDSITDRELEEMHRTGARGIRFNVVDVATDKGVISMDPVRRMAERVKALGWHVQFLMHVDDYPDLEKMFENFPTDIVIDHFGYLKPENRSGRGFQGFLRLLKAGRCWCKFTGAYRISRQEMPYADATPIAHSIIEANADRVVWGTDWPHPKHEGKMPNDGEMCDRLADWIPDEATRAKVLVDNPARLYGF